MGLVGHSCHPTGTLPQEEVRRSKELGRAELHAGLRRVNDRLKNFSHVNKKAMDQFTTFREQREGLMTRKAELDEGYEAIKELITVRVAHLPPARRCAFFFVGSRPPTS